MFTFVLNGYETCLMLRRDMDLLCWRMDAEWNVCKPKKVGAVQCLENTAW